jgi:hypothetical protein
LRAGPLSDEKVIAQLNRYFVPVYASNEDYRKDGSAPPDERKLYQQIYREAVTQKRSSGTVCVYLVAPDGKGFDSMVVSRAAEPGNLQKMLEVAVAGLKTAEGKPLVAPAPQATPPKAEPGALVLHLVSRYDRRGSWAEFPAENYIVLTPKEWAQLLPAGEAKVNADYGIDRGVAAKVLTYFFPQTELCDFALATSADGPYKHKIEQMELRGRVIAVKGTAVRVRLEGSVKLKHNFYPGRDDNNFASATVLGVLDHDRQKQRPSLRLVTDQATYGQHKFSVAVRTIP